MNFSNLRHTRWMAGALAGAMLVATVAPAAQADPGRRYRGDGGYRDGRSSGSVYIVRRSSGAGPAIAGFLGGLFLGAILARNAPDGYVYHDPYCDDDFTSLEVYRAHLRRYHHPRIIRVIERDNGRCLRTYGYDDGAWRPYDDGGYGGGYYDNGYDNGYGRGGYYRNGRGDSDSWRSYEQARRYRDDRGWNNDPRWNRRDDGSWDRVRARDDGRYRDDRRYRDNRDNRDRDRDEGDDDSDN